MPLSIRYWFLSQCDCSHESSGESSIRQKIRYFEIAANRVRVVVDSPLNVITPLLNVRKSGINHDSSCIHVVIV